MEKIIKLSIKYSKALEKERVINTVKRFPWYRENGYDVGRMNLPRKLNRQNLSDIPDDILEDAIDSEYDESKFVASKESIEKIFPPYQKKLEDFLKEIGLSVITPVNVQLTAYGTGGSYSLPDKIIVNTKNYNIGLVKTVLHEIVHLHIQHLIHAHKVGQWQKERIVDLLMGKLVPGLATQQQMSIDVSSVDEAFNKYFPDVSRIIETVGTL